MFQELQLNIKLEGDEMVLPSTLYGDYSKFERIVKKHKTDGKQGVLDCSYERFLAPTTLIPLLCYIRNNNIQYIKTHPNTQSYVKRILNKEKTDTTTPYTILPNTPEERTKNRVAMGIATKINYHKFCGLKTIYHICNELTSNIYNHTPFEKGYANQGYLYSQEYPREHKLDLTIMDDGLSIPGRLERHNIDFEDDCDAIFKAINGCTTAKDKDYESRGMGLWSTIKLVVECNKGSVLIVSRNGCLHIDGKGKYKYRYQDNNSIFKGTLFSVRLNDSQIQNFEEEIGISTHNEYHYIKK